MAPLTTGFSLPSQERLFLTHVGNVRPGGGVDAEYVPLNVWSTLGMYATVLTNAGEPAFATS